MPGQPSQLDGLLTPDRRYLVVRGRLWRATNPSLSEAERTRATKALMDARRAVRTALRAGNEEQLRRARARVDRAKRTLGERGPVWWTDGAPDHNRRMVSNTPYAEWFARIERLHAVMLQLMHDRAEGASICPSEVARAAGPGGWRGRLDDVRAVGRHLAARGIIAIMQRGHRLPPDLPLRGPVRFALQDRTRPGPAGPHRRRSGSAVQGAAGGSSPRDTEPGSR